MKYNEMTFQQKRRFKGCRCPLCGENINRYQDVQITQVRDGRCIHNFYIHSSCLLHTLKNTREQFSYEDTDSIKISLKVPSQLEKKGGIYEEAIN